MAEYYTVRIDIYKWDDETSDSSEELVEEVASVQFMDYFSAYSFANSIDVTLGYPGTPHG